MTAEDYRWGSVRLSADIRHMREPVELAMRMKLTDDSYLRTYETEASSGFDTLKQRFFGFLHRGKEEAALNENIRGLIGDGRSNGRSKPTINAIEPLPNRQVYFNPYADAPANRNRAVLSEAAKPAAAAAAAAAPAVAPVPAEVTSATAAQAAAAPSQPVTAPPLAAPPLTAPPLTAPPLTAPPLTATTDPVQTPVWPAVGNGYATAPARIPEFAPDFRFNDGRLPPPLPPNAGLDLANIGRAPRTGRMASNEISGVPMLLRPPVARRSFPWPWAVALFLVCSSLVFGFLVLGGLQGSNGRLGQIVQTMFPGNELNLRVRNEDDRLRLTWNQRNHSVESASDATLQIFDGATHREIHLDGRQVADGSVLYRPVTNDVTFRLEVHSEQGPTSGSVRVLDGLSGRQATLDVSAPAAPLNPVQTAVGPAPVNPAAVDSGSVPASTTPYDPNQAAALTAQVPPPTTGTSGLPFSATAVPVPRTAYRKSAAPRYETPDTIEPIPASGGSTINGWDTAEQRPRVAKPRATTPATFPPTVPTTAGFVAPRPLIQVTPNILSIPSGTIPTRTRVAVQVEIDPAGHVTSARVVDSGVNPAVSGAAVAAARKWTFDPASSNGRHVNSEHTIMFEFPVR
jgi:TonB family protein